MRVAILVAIATLLAVTLGCAPLATEAPVTSPVVKYVPPTPQPDGTLAEARYETNYVTHPGTVIDPNVLRSAQDSARLFGPYGELFASLLALGVAGYAKYSNTRALQKHLDAEHAAVRKP